ncbi:MAG: response regulator [Lachnospiraceae bacterium]|nr:response regulator [Lachnospiraceae bacterium]
MYQAIINIQWVNILIILIEAWVVFVGMKNKVHYYLYLLCMAMLINSTGYLLALYSHTEDTYFQAIMFSWVGKVWITFAMFCFSKELSKSHIPWIVTFLFGAFSVATFVVVITTKTTNLFYTDIRFAEENGMILFQPQKGPWGWVWDIAVMLTVTVSFVMLLIGLSGEKNRQKRKQFIIVMLALVVELMIGVLVTSPLSKYYDINQFGFSIAAVMILVAIFRYNLMDTEYVAKEYMIDELSTGVIVTDVYGDVTYYNNTAENLFPDIKSDAQKVLYKVKDMLRGDGPVSIGTRSFTFEERPLIHKEKTVGTIYVLLDNTQYYNYLNELEEQKQIAEEANKAKSIFLANMSHEIRTPINSVLGMNEMILRETNEKNVREYAMDIQAAGQSLLSIINDILDLSKIESGKMEVTPAVYDIVNLVSEISNMTETSANNKGLLYNVYVSPGVPSKLFGDDVMIRQVLTNLLTNAVKYTSRGSVSLMVSVRPYNNEPLSMVKYSMLHFEVEDTGIGIKSADMRKLFSAYERIESGQNRNVEGSGLGITISMKMLDLMDSRLEVSSEYGKGSVFSFDLRQKIVDDTPVGDYEGKVQRRVGQKHSYEPTFSAPDAHILVVDDNSTNRKVFSSLLRPTGIKVTEVSNGQDAVDITSKHYFDIIFMDHMMPGMDGVEAMKRIKRRENGPCSNTPIIVLTANAVAGSKEKYMEDGFDGFLAKPISSDRLEEIIRDVLRKDKLKEAVPYKEPEDETEGFPMITGIDWEVAMMRIHDEKIVRTVLEDFVNTIKPQTRKLERLKAGFPDTIEDYRTMVHGVKSGSGTMGMIPLSGMAFVLEKAAKEKDYETIDRLHDPFIKEWRSYEDRLKDYLRPSDGADEEEKEEIPDEILEAILRMLSASMDLMDIDGADDAIEKLSGFRLPDYVEKEMDDLKDAVAELDQDGVARILETIRKGRR